VSFVVSLSVIIPIVIKMCVIHPYVAAPAANSATLVSVAFFLSPPPLSHFAKTQQWYSQTFLR
jgi:hypothetical protein